ncbi:hypothetical protein IWW46_002436 [Coemansia sp. RSA 2440]|nr:hypothetical protein IWW46_002436 [Coemansia sp. RSA 2440]
MKKIMIKSALTVCRQGRGATLTKSIATSAQILAGAVGPTTANTHTADNTSIQRNVTIGFTEAQKHAVAPLTAALTTLPLVEDMEANSAFVRKEFHWPIGKCRTIQAPSTLAYGALSGINDLPILPLVYQWKPGNTPTHLDTGIYNGSFQSPEQQQSISHIRVPGVSMVHYLGPNLGFNGTASRENGVPAVVHTGVPAALLDDITARVSLSNTPNKPTFTANFKLEYLQPVPTNSYVVLDAWVTKIEGRKTFISSYLADARSNKVLVHAQSLFVCAA